MYFLEKESELCHSLDTIKDMIRREGLKEKDVFTAVQERNTGMFWCLFFGEIGFSNESCGKQCKEYRPRNGKSGICCDHRTPYSHGEKITISI